MKHIVSKLKRIALATAAVASGAWAIREAQVSAQGGQNQNEARQQDEGIRGAGTAQRPVNVATVTGILEKLVGRTITVVGEVDDVEGTRVLKLVDNAHFREGIHDELVVVASRDASWQASDEWAGAWVRVTGTVQRREDPAFESDIGDLGSEIEHALVGHDVVVVASSVQPITP